MRKCDKTGRSQPFQTQNRQKAGPAKAGPAFIQGFPPKLTLYQIYFLFSILKNAKKRAFPFVGNALFFVDFAHGKDAILRFPTAHFYCISEQTSLVYSAVSSTGSPAMINAWS